MLMPAKSICDCHPDMELEDTSRCPTANEEYEIGPVCEMEGPRTCQNHSKNLSGHPCIHPLTLW